MLFYLIPCQDLSTNAKFPPNGFNENLKSTGFNLITIIILSGLQILKSHARRSCTCPVHQTHIQAFTDHKQQKTH